MRKKTIDMIPILSEDIKPALSSFAKAAPFRQVWSKEPGSSFWHHRGCLIRRLPHRLVCIITMLQPGETVFLRRSLLYGRLNLTPPKNWKRKSVCSFRTGNVLAHRLYLHRHRSWQSLLLPAGIRVTLAMK